MTGITAAKSKYITAIINAGTKVKCSVKYHIEDEFKTLFKTVYNYSAILNRSTTVFLAIFL